eukprot:TRINITY_DN6558_c0_g4_i1.p1 TRINITY_DN6558_c0_g4~~TRINITY_DN6558_c0_g4_i1.p1  ORF type:complete len:529 (+),score=52.52 TRINITY_DN6558_c0_g4_i1:46-1587(+)
MGASVSSAHRDDKKGPGKRKGVGGRASSSSAALQGFDAVVADKPAHENTRRRRKKKNAATDAHYNVPHPPEYSAEAARPSIGRSGARAAPDPQDAGPASAPSAPIQVPGTSTIPPLDALSASSSVPSAGAPIPRRLTYGLGASLNSQMTQSTMFSERGGLFGAIDHDDVYSECSNTNSLWGPTCEAPSGESVWHPAPSPRARADFDTGSVRSHSSARSGRPPTSSRVPRGCGPTQGSPAMSALWATLSDAGDFDNNENVANIITGLEDLALGGTEVSGVESGVRTSVARRGRTSVARGRASSVMASSITPALPSGPALTQASACSANSPTAAAPASVEAPAVDTPHALSDTCSSAPSQAAGPGRLTYALDMSQRSAASQSTMFSERGCLFATIDNADVRSVGSNATTLWGPSGDGPETSSARVVGALPAPMRRGGSLTAPVTVQSPDKSTCLFNTTSTLFQTMSDGFEVEEDVASIITGIPKGSDLPASPLMRSHQRPRSNQRRTRTSTRAAE